jgi:hypothetical protein
VNIDLKPLDLSDKVVYESLSLTTEMKSIEEFLIEHLTTRFYQNSRIVLYNKQTWLHEAFSCHFVRNIPFLGEILFL